MSQTKECIPLGNTVPLSRLKAGDNAQVVRLSDETPEAARSLLPLGITGGVSLKVESVAPFGGPLMVRLGSALYSIEPKMAGQVLVRREFEATVALVGNPNCGKSTMFQALTGLDIETANYAGSTLEIHRAITEHHGQHLELIDLPGIYSIGGANEDERITRQALIELAPDAVIVALDTLNLARNLFLLLQVIELGYPVSVALNFTDLASRRRICTDAAKLSELLGVPAIATVATTGKGLDELMHSLECPSLGKTPHYSNSIETLFAEIAPLLGESPIPARSAAITVLECEGVLPLDPEVSERIRVLGEAFFLEHGERPEHRIARERHGIAGIIASQVQTCQPQASPFSEKVWQWSITPGLGLLMLGAVATGLMGMLFLVSGVLNDQIGRLWSWGISPQLQLLFHSLFGRGLLAKSLLWGFDSGLLSVVSVGIAYLLPFFFLLGLLEDSGYYGSIVFLLDRLMHRFGLHGRSAISLVTGLGCNVPAILSCRILAHRKERFIAATLATLIPCAPRIAVIVGAVALTAGWAPGAAVLVTVLLTIVAVGLLLNRILPGESHGFVMEMFPLRRPNLLPTLRKAWNNFKEFLLVGAPFVLVGCICLGAFYESGNIWLLTEPLRPLMEGWFGLPVIAGLTLVFAFLRKELALQLLITFAIATGHGHMGQGTALPLQSIMTVKQLVIFALVNTLYIPCIASVGALVKTVGWKDALGIAGVTLLTAFLIGGAANLVLR